MSSNEIQVLLQPPNANDSRDRVHSLLDSKYPTVVHLVDLEATIEQALVRKQSLGSQLADSQPRIYALASESRMLAATHVQSAQELSLRRQSLSDELLFLSRDLVSTYSEGGSKPTILEEVETLHRNLKELESVKGYMQIIEHALKLSETAVEQVRSSAATASISRASLKLYESLEHFIVKVSQGCSQVDEGSQQPFQLLDFLETLLQKTWTDIKNVLTSTLLAASEKLGWPMPVDYLAAAPEDRQAFEVAFNNMLNLQTISQKSLSHRHGSSQGHGLYPIDALVQPISLRFKFHFEGSRQTNRLDKPEWFFTHILNAIHEHQSFMDAVIQDLLSSTEYRGIIARHEFTFLLLPILSRKLKRIVPSLLSHPSLLAHTIYQALLFDAVLTEDGFALSGTSALPKDASPDENQDGPSWGGISEVIVGNKEWFETWLEGERKFVDDQYHEIISDPVAWTIVDDDGQDAPIDRELKTTNSARRLKAMVEQVTDRYSPLRRFSQRTRFFLSVQLPPLEQYHARISSSLDAFETLSSAFVRAVPGTLGVSLGGGGPEGGVQLDPRKPTEGVEGLHRLCKALVSSKFVETAMERWGETLFFLELWVEINRRASLRVKAENHPSLPGPKKATDVDAPEGTIFEELVHMYRKLFGRAEDMIAQQVCGEVESSLKPHFALILSASKSEADQTNVIALPQTLLGPIALLSAHLKLLQSTIPQTLLTALYRRIGSHLSEHILHREILYRGHHRLSLYDGQSIAAECELWVETCLAALNSTTSGLSRTRVEAPWLKLLEAGRLLSVEGQNWNRIIDATFGTTSDEVWEELLVDVVGVAEMRRDEVGQVLRVREDCDR